MPSEIVKYFVIFVSIEVIPECGGNKAPKGQCDVGLVGLP